MIVISACLITIGIYWIYFSLLTFMQGVKLNNIVSQYEELGTAQMGRDARFLACRANVILAHDQDGKILAATKIRPAFVVIPHKATELPQLVGKDLFHLDIDSLDVDARVKMALTNMVAQMDNIKERQVAQELHRRQDEEIARRNREQAEAYRKAKEQRKAARKSHRK